VPGGEEKAVAIDASVLINLAVVDQLGLLAALDRYRFVVPLDALEEIERPEQRRRVDAAIAAAHLHIRELTSPAVLERRAGFLQEMDPGESACLAVAIEEGWLVACDEKRVFRRRALEHLGEGRLLNTVGLFVLGIREVYLSVADADHAKDVLADNSFRVKFRSFEDLL